VDLNELMLFTRVVQSGSFIAASKALGMPKSTVSRKIADLEDRLERVLREWEAPPTPIHIVYPSTRHVSPTVRSFIEHVQEHMTPPPWQIGPVR
jgi:DNA-binding transcriptional LysR family regulator